MTPPHGTTIPCFSLECFATWRWTTGVRSASKKSPAVPRRKCPGLVQCRGPFPVQTTFTFAPQAHACRHFQQLRDQVDPHPAVTKACQSLGIALDVIGKGFNTATSKPEEVLPATTSCLPKPGARSKPWLSVQLSYSVISRASEPWSIVPTSPNCESSTLGRERCCARWIPQLIAAEIKSTTLTRQSGFPSGHETSSLTSAAVDWLELY